MRQSKYRMMTKAGALQEGVEEAPPPQQSFTPPTSRPVSYLTSAPLKGIVPSQQAREPDALFDEFAIPQQIIEQFHMTESPVEEPWQGYADAHQTNVNLRAVGSPVTGTQGRGELMTLPSPSQQSDAQHHNQELNMKMSLFFYTVPEGQKVLMIDKKGKGKILEGPARVWRRGAQFVPLKQYVAYPGEFLIARHTDGSQEHLPGPATVWLDPRIYTSIEKEDALQLAAKEAIVVYSQNDEQNDNSEAPSPNIKRRIVLGPNVFIPAPGEWLHTFSWHGSKGKDYKKYPGALVFQKLWLMPDQMYHDVVDVRTADDVVLTIKLMIFFELVDLEKMLDETHDPIGDFINATSSDVLDLVGRYSFEEFKQHTERLNNVENYTQLLNRAKQVGYNINKIVYRGYTTSQALRKMHEEAIETRTRLKLKRETEEQAQKLSDFKQQREFERAEKTRIDKKLQEEHELELQQKRHEHQLKLQQKQWELEQEQRRQQEQEELLHQQKILQQRLDYFKELAQLNVDLTSFLTQNRADQVIEIRGHNETSPHLHLESKK